MGLRGVGCWGGWLGVLGKVVEMGEDMRGGMVGMGIKGDLEDLDLDLDLDLDSMVEDLEDQEDQEDDSERNEG